MYFYVGEEANLVDIDIVANVLTDEIVGYEDLKKAVLDHLKANKHELIEQALAAVELGDKRPSQLVADIKKRFNAVSYTHLTLPTIYSV